MSRKLFLNSCLGLLSEVASKANSAAADFEQDEDGSGDEDSGCENSPDQGCIMDFSAAAIAEQLTRSDSVCCRILHLLTLPCVFLMIKR